jgi:drug/metabolite transporter (DMT)-like permease
MSPQLPSHKLAWIFLALSSMFWAGNIVLARALHADIPPIALNFWRWTVALAIMLPFTVGLVRAQWPAVRREWRYLALLGFTGMAAFHSLQYTALNLTTAVNVSLILAITPVAIPIMAWMFWGDRITARQGAGILLSFVGVAAIVTRGDPMAVLSRGLAAGDLIEVAAMILWSLYSTLVRWRPPDLHPNVMLVCSMAPAVLFILPAYLWEAANVRAMPVDWQSLAMIAHVSLMASVAAFIFFNRAVEVVGPTRAGLFIHLIPIFATGAAVTFLDERLFLHHGVGAATIAAGLYLTTTQSRVARSMET